MEMEREEELDRRRAGTGMEITEEGRECRRPLLQREQERGVGTGIEIGREDEQGCSQHLLQRKQEFRAETGIDIKREEGQGCRQTVMQSEQERLTWTGMEIGREEEQECRQPLLQREQQSSMEVGKEIETEDGQALLPQHRRPEEFKFRCSREVELLEFRDKIVFRSVDDEAPAATFSIGRTDGVLQPLEGNSTNFGKPVKVSSICGVAGTIKLLAGTYVLVITSREEVGSYLGVPIFLVKSMKFLSCNEALKHSTAQEKRDEAYFMTLLRTLETTPGLYYSYEGDLTLNIQRTSRLVERRRSTPLWKQADPRFVWNRILLEELIECKLDIFSIPMIQGSFNTTQFTLKDLPAKISLFSRRCMRRLGTRMWRRGADLEGDTANFVETEQVLEFEGFTSSFLQVRGSIPLLWEQIVDLSYKPQLNIISHIETPRVIERHFHDLVQRYGETIAVDLTDKHGDEGRLSTAFTVEMEKLPHVRYVSFDFHHFCGNGNFDNLQLLYDQIAETVEKQGFFLLNSDGETLATQKGIVRVNCIDCLDRTNVTQSYLARRSLNLQLQKIGVLSSNECISTITDVYDKFKILWAQNGDDISLEYSGTYALKGDLVRYGRQTLFGLLKDGMSAISRYYLNNFYDGIRQDALDLISGRYTINRSSPSPFQLNGIESSLYLPMASALIVGGLTLSTFTFNQAGRNTQHVVSSVLWAGLAAGALAVVKANGRQFCSRPRLCKLL